VTGTVTLGHGSGGKLMAEMIHDLIGTILGIDPGQMDDSALVSLPSAKIAFTTDSYTITPIFFPGGDIGSLAVNGTVNDLAVLGARPLLLSLALILEEGLEIKVLERVLQSIRGATDAVGVRVVTGDTKVVGRGNADKIFINTSGIGVMEGDPPRREISPGDRVLINGPIGDHGIAIMAERSQLSFTRGLSSDCAPLSRLIRSVLDRCPNDVKFMRDATRGGVASVLNEIVASRSFGVVLREERLPVREEVRGVCDILGIDPLYAANEGKVVMIVQARAVPEVLEAMRGHPQGAAACEIGEVTAANPGMVSIETRVGGQRLLPLLLEEQLPRIC